MRHSTIVLFSLAVSACGPATRTQPEKPPRVLPVCDCGPRYLNVCIVEGGELREVPTNYNVVTGDTLVEGKPFSEAYPLTRDYGLRHAWFIERQPILLEGRRYVPYGLPRVEGSDKLLRVGEHGGVSLFAQKDAGHPPDTIYVPQRTGCEFRTYVPETDR